MEKKQFPLDKILTSNGIYMREGIEYCIETDLPMSNYNQVGVHMEIHKDYPSSTPLPLFSKIIPKEAILVINYKSSMGRYGSNLSGGFIICADGTALVPRK